MAKSLTLIITLFLGLICLVISFFQFREKGFLFNNAYLWASKEERQSMNKKPFYRQSGIVFVLLAAVFLCVSGTIITGQSWFYIVEGILIVIVVVYAIISSVKLNKKQRIHK